MRASIPVAAAVAAVVGFGGTLAIILSAAAALGASQAETASWVTALCLALAIESAWLSWWTGMPVIAAWSSPGAALIAASHGFTMADGVGAFIITALLLIATGLFGPLTRLIGRLPVAVASGMLAGILVVFTANAVKTVPAEPLFMLPLIAVFFLVRLANPGLATPVRLSAFLSTVSCCSKLVSEIVRSCWLRATSASARIISIGARVPISTCFLLSS